MSGAWIIALGVLLASIVIQHCALKRRAFGRSMLLTGMAFLASFLFSFIAEVKIAWVLFWVFQAVGWGLITLMTGGSLWYLRHRKRRLRGTRF